MLGKKIEMIKMDTQCVPAEGFSDGRVLFNIDKVDLMLGAMCSSVTKALQPVVESAKISIMAAACSDPEITYRPDVGSFKVLDEVTVWMIPGAMYGQHGKDFFGIDLDSYYGTI